MTPRARVVPLTAVAAVVVVVALAGPVFAPYPAITPVGAPYAGPGPQAWLGTDHLGRDVLSRILDGGPGMLATTALGTAVAVGLGVTAGVVAAFAGAHRRILEGLVLRPLDAVVALPPILVLVLALTALPDRRGVVIAVAAAGVPLTARVTYAAASLVIGRPHIELAIARGERWGWVLRQEVLPLIAGTVAADAGLRFVVSLYMVTAAGFLGLGDAGTDWGTLIAQALPGAALQPVALLAPLALIAALTVPLNLASDALVAR
ncbi:peptide/nickel transport system permease protein [Micromonospora sp. Llam0]|uniref:ABC transporter permease subunit n=1 Tax=Micromonospora sp. Llam0 TaxID=2485143 RepID=UPI000F489720|nr:ABC transporter permease subunit [Micromonospora sp. Llam0]ROO60454.1 peptide/nickel transport system permease protein [Micromonospora sp. Llam0]